MRAFAKITIGVIGVAMMTSPADASEPKPVSDPLAIQALHTFATCIANRTPQDTARMLAMDFRTSAFQRQLRQYATGHADCMAGRGMRFTGLLLSGSLAEAMLARQLGKESLTPRISSAASSTFDARSEAERLSVCVLQHQPALASEVLVTKPASTQEAVALSSAGPALQACVAPTGVARFNKPALRALLALAAYRMITYPGATPVAGH